MGQKSAIEWLQLFGEGGHSWNPIRSRLKEQLVKIVNAEKKIIPAGKVGWFCVKVNELCAGCYAEDQNVVCGTNPGRMGNGVRYALDQLTKVEIFLDEKTLQQPLHWKKPAGIFPCSMTDLFGGFVPESFIARAYDVMEAASWHTFLVLTKRPATRRNFLARRYKGRKPAPNIWEGVSVGNQETADDFIPELLQTPAALRWVSAEPLLGAIDFDKIPFRLTEPPRLGNIRWCVAGGESGPNARPMHPAWARSLRDQCQAAGVPYFFKQWGEWTPHSGFRPPSCVFIDGKLLVNQILPPGTPLHSANGAQWMRRIGKKAAGRLLDGREWNEFPEVVRA